VIAAQHAHAGMRASPSTLEDDGNGEDDDQTAALNVVSGGEGRPRLMVLLFLLSYAAPVGGGAFLYYSYLTGITTGTLDYDRLLDAYATHTPLMIAAMQTTWVMIVQSADPVTLPQNAQPTQSPSPLPTPLGFPHPTATASHSPASSESPAPTPLPIPVEGNLFFMAGQIPFFHRANAIAAAKTYLAILEEAIQAGLWSTSYPMLYISDPPNLDLFEDFLPLRDPDHQAPPFTDLERLFVGDQMFAPEVLHAQLSQWLLILEAYRLPVLALNEHPFFSGQLFYYLTTVAESQRLQPLVDCVLAESRKHSDGQAAKAETVCLIVCFVQVLVVITLAAFLIHMGASQRRALALLLFFSPNVTLQNPAIVGLLTTGESPERDSASSFDYAQHVVRHSRDAVILADRELRICDFNAAALRLLDVTDTALRGALLPDAMGLPADTITAIVDVLQGIDPPPQPDDYPITVGDQTRIVAMHTTYVTELGVFKKGQSLTTIRGVMLQVHDLTEQRLLEKKVESEVAHVRRMLERVMPSPIVKQLAEGTEAVAFAVQSASIGAIRVITAEDGFGGVHKVFELFDSWMEPFQQLTKVNVLSNEYVFAGGVFTSTNRPDKHAEEAVRFALGVIAGTETIQAVAPGVTVLVGINTGGPLVAGIISVARPAFQLLGLSVDSARELVASAEPGELLVTRAVYELVYSHNFKVSDRGDVPLQRGKSAHAYVITP
jgi:PAS domain-containing protein